MYYEDNDRHHLPHIHCRYQEHKVALSIEDDTILDGEIPSR
jgi:hypothetical protein